MIYKEEAFAISYSEIFDAYLVLLLQ